VQVSIIIRLLSGYLSECASSAFAHSRGVRNAREEKVSPLVIPRMKENQVDLWRCKFSLQMKLTG